MDEHSSAPSLWRSPLGIFMLAAGALGFYYLLTEHLAHVGQALPYLFLLACPLMHLFHGHGHHHSHGGHEQEERRDAPSVDGTEPR
ncbi:MAG TPA: DUF2933 domain-containing protein [Roseateles sp.]